MVLGEVGGGDLKAQPSTRPSEWPCEETSITAASLLGPHRAERTLEVEALGRRVDRDLAGVRIPDLDRAQQADPLLAWVRIDSAR